MVSKRSFFELSKKSSDIRSGLDYFNKGTMHNGRRVYLDTLRWNSGIIMTLKNDNSLTTEMIIEVAKYVTDLTNDISLQSRLISLLNISSILSVRFIQSKNIDRRLVKQHYDIVDFLISNECKKLIFNLKNDKLVEPVFGVITNIMIGESHVFKRRMSMMKEETINELDNCIMTLLEKHTNLNMGAFISDIIKIMQFRMRKFKSSPMSKKVIEWYFENVFGKRLNADEFKKINNYVLAQALLNISFLDFDLTSIEKHLYTMKNETLDRISDSNMHLSPKNLVQMMSSVFRMNLVFLKTNDDLNLMKKITYERLPEMNIIDLQSILNGFALVYEVYSYNPEIIDPIIKKLIEFDGPVNSLILTNIMKSLNMLRIDNSKLYSWILLKIKQDYKKLDNIALVYSFTRLARLNQIDHANELLEFLEEKVQLFDKLVNPHNTFQALQSLAIIKNYNIDYWNALIDGTDYASLDEDLLKGLNYIDSARVASLL